MIQVYRYNEVLKDKAGTETEVQPWLHCVLYRNLAVIYVWDTRQVVEIAGCDADSIYVDELTEAKDNGMPLIGLEDKQSLNAKFGFENKQVTEQIRNLLQTSKMPERLIACFKAILRIWEIQSPSERSKGMNTKFDGIGFSKVHIRPMGDIASKLAKGNFGLIDSNAARYACNVAPMYARQLSILSTAGIRSTMADNFEKQYRRYLQSCNSINL